MADAKKEATAKKSNAVLGFFKKIGKFFKDCKGEVKKIVWPTPKACFRNMAVVLVAIIALGICIFCLDTVFMKLLGLVMETAA